MSRVSESSFKTVASRRPRKFWVLLAFLAVYVLWGSTYLAIRFAIDTLPPFIMAGTRFVVAGVILYAWARWQGATKPTWIHWRSTLIIGGLLLMTGNGGVVWAEQVVPSGLTALLVAAVPLWMALLDWTWHGGGRPSGRLALGLLFGFAGVAILVGPEQWAGGGHVNRMGALVLMVASFSWATGSLYSRKAPLPASSLLATAMEMLAGGGLLLVLGGLTGQGAKVHLSAVSLRSALSLAYLIVFGSLIGFSAYIWLLKVTSSARVSTYAYVNPVVAVFLGWAVGGEAVNPRTLLAAAVIVAAVVLITSHRDQSAVPAPGESTNVGEGVGVPIEEKVPLSVNYDQCSPQ